MKPPMAPANNGSDVGPLVIGRMSDFDKLPKVVREALRNSDHNWSGTSCLEVLRKRKVNRPPGANSPKALAEFIRNQDRIVHKRDAKRGIVCGGQRP